MSATTTAASLDAAGRLRVARGRKMTCEALDAEHAAWRDLVAEVGRERARELSSHIRPARATR